MSDMVLLKLAKDKEHFICLHPFHEISVLSDGRVTTCCADYRGELAIGNVKDQDIMSLWQGDKYREITTYNYFSFQCIYRHLHLFEFKDGFFSNPLERAGGGEDGGCDTAGVG